MSFRRIFLALILCLILFLSFLFLTLPHSPLSKGEAPLLAGRGISSPPSTPTPPPTPSPTPSPAEIRNLQPKADSPLAETSTIYTVKSGDTLDSIARSHGVPWLDLANYNQIEDPNFLSIGQEIILPPVGARPDSPETPNIDPYYINKISEICNLTSEICTTKHILIVLSEQKLYTYEGGTQTGEYLISSGVPAHPTVTGEFKIWIKLPSTLMTGEGYYLPDVPYTMYFYGDYGIHGTYWHNNFGTPMSHGCINMKTEDAEIVFNWAEVGTIVDIVP